MKQGDLVAIVLGGSGNGYDAVKSLIEHGVGTFLLSSHSLKVGRYPHAKVMRCPDPSQPGRLVAFMNQEVASGTKAVLLPTSDSFAVFLAKHYHRLDSRFMYFGPTPELVQACANKAEFHFLCVRARIPSPRTWVIGTISDIERLSEKILFPCIAKPLFSGALPTSVIDKVVRVLDLKELHSLVRAAVTHNGQILVQEEIPGGVESLVFVGGLYDEHHQPEKIFVGHKVLDYPLRGGTASLATLAWNNEAVRLANQFASRTCYTGLVDIEFKCDSRDGGLKIIEVNPRIGQFHRISHDGYWDIVSYYFCRVARRRQLPADFDAHKAGRLWIYPHNHLCSRVEGQGLVHGTVSWMRDMLTTRIKCAWDIRDLRRCCCYARVVLGHIRRLGLRTLLFGRRSRHDYFSLRSSCSGQKNR